MTEVHVCLFPEWFTYPDFSGGTWGVNVYDNEDEIEDRKQVGRIVRSQPGWECWFKPPHRGPHDPNGFRLGVYPSIRSALEDLAYTLGQYWSPRP